MSYPQQPLGTPQGWPSQPQQPPQPPPPKPPGVEWSKVILGAGLAMIAAVVVVAVASTSGTGTSRRNTTPIERIVAYRDGTGIRVCASQELHDCALRVGTVQGRDRILGFFGTISRPASCDTQREDAARACADAGHPESYEGPARAAFLVCMAGAGVIDGEVPGYSRIEDPRESHHTDAHLVGLQCREGIAEFRFQIEGY